MSKTALKFYLRHPGKIVLGIVNHCWFLFSDKTSLKIQYRIKMGRRLNLKNPKRFSEKLQWLKLYDRKPEYTKMVDKIAAKDYVASIIGNQYIIPTLGTWNHFDEIDFDTLPDKFVLKTNHGGGGSAVVICKDKSKFNKNRAKAILEHSLKHSVYSNLREWPYKNVKPMILAEQLLEGNENEIPDYKIFCFNGEPKFCQVISGRKTKMCIDFFDHEWIHQPFHEPRDFPFASLEPQKPEHFEIMWEMARKLSKGHPFFRVDFYDINKELFFGELTFFPTSGMGGFDPDDYDEILGNMISLP